MKRKALIVDGHNFLFRGFYGVPDQVKRKDGTHINAVYGFFSLLRTISKTINFDYLIVVFDSETAANNKKISRPEYKANRLPQNNSIFFQLDLIKKSLDILGIHWVEHATIEADDVIGIYSQQLAGKGIHVHICSNDFDFIQLISPEISVIRGYHGEVVFFDEKRVAERFSIHPSQYVDFISLTGDASDNIKGIKGIGKKRAANLLSQYGNIQKIYQSIDFFSPSLKKLLQEHEDFLLKQKKFLAIQKNQKLLSKLNIKSIVFLGNKIPEKMGAFLDLNWGKLI